MADSLNVAVVHAIANCCGRKTKGDKGDNDSGLQWCRIASDVLRNVLGRVLFRRWGTVVGK